MIALTMDMQCEELPGPADYIKEEPESEEESALKTRYEVATITGIYMNRSSGVSLQHQLQTINNNLSKEEHYAAADETPTIDVKKEEISDDDDDDGGICDIRDLENLPADEMKFLKYRPTSKKKERKQPKPKRQKDKTEFPKEDRCNPEVPLNSDIKDDRNASLNSEQNELFKEGILNMTHEVESGREENPKGRKKTRKKREPDKVETTKRTRYKQERRLECDYCPELCVSKEERDAHIEEVHPDYIGRFICVPCNKDFGGRRQLKMHKNTEHKQSEYTCPVCNSKFVNKLSFKRHMLTHTDNPLYVCSYCGKSNFIARADMERHIRSIHTKEKPYVCKYEGCGKRFPSSGCRSKHYVTHTGIRKHECEYCGIKMQRTSDLRQHIKKHTGEKPFQCTICGMAFARSYRLKMHRLVIHQVNEHGEKVERRKPTSEERPHQCETCGKRFCDKTNLQRHYATHTNDRSFVCDTCGSAFNFESNLQRHIQTVHLGKFTYKCDTCNMGCRDKDDYERHMAKHTGLRNHSCPICNKSFYTKDALTGHFRTVHQAVRSSCSVCGTTFKEIRSHQNHLVKVHKLPEEQVILEIREAKKYKREQAEYQEKPVLKVPEESHSTQIYYNCDICKRDLLSIKSLPKHYMKVHKLSLEEAEARARQEDGRKWHSVQQQNAAQNRQQEFHTNGEVPAPPISQSTGPSAEEIAAAKLIPTLDLFPTSDVSASAFAQAYFMKYRGQLGM